MRWILCPKAIRTDVFPEPSEETSTAQEDGTALEGLPEARRTWQGCGVGLGRWHCWLNQVYELVVSFTCSNKYDYNYTNFILGPNSPSHLLVQLSKAPAQLT